jgi:hypothetical protein
LSAARRVAISVVFFDDSDGAELARTEWAFKRIDEPDVFD